MSLRRDQPALDMLGAILDAILSYSGADDLGTVGADLDAAVGDLRANAQGLLRRAAINTPLFNCFDLARGTGMTFDAMERLRTALAALTTTDARATILQARGMVFCCIQEAAILADTTFPSRNEVERVQGLATAAFTVSQDAMADLGDADTYRALVGLRAAMVRDLTDRARPLPQLVSYSLANNPSSLVLAQRLYGDASRADELVQENEVVNPLFMPSNGRSLSA
jgi:prophage DNA circulation protein